jgi:hypothetical protein
VKPFEYGDDNEVGIPISESTVFMHKELLIDLDESANLDELQR